MHTKKMKVFRWCALFVGVTLGGLFCSTWFISSLLASTNSPYELVASNPVTMVPFETREPIVITMQPVQTPSTIVITALPKVTAPTIEIKNPPTQTPIVMTVLPKPTVPTIQIINPPTQTPIVVTPFPIVTESPIETTMPPTITPTPGVIKTPSSATSKTVTQSSSTPIPTSEKTPEKTVTPSTNENVVIEQPNQEKIVQRFYVGKKQYYVNEMKNEMDTVPIIKDGRTLMPIRYVSESFGATVDWNSKDKKVTITYGQKLVELWIGKEAALVDGSLRRLDVAPEIIEGRTVLPLRFVSENLGLKVSWDKDLQEVKITN